MLIGALPAIDKPSSTTPTACLSQRKPTVASVHRLAIVAARQAQHRKHQQQSATARYHHLGMLSARSHCQLLSTADVVKVEQVRPQRHTSLASSLDGSQRLLEQDIATTAKLGTADFCLTSPSWIHKRSPPSTAQSSKGASHKTSRTPVCTAQQRSHFGHLAEKHALPHHFPQEQLS